MIPATHKLFVRSKFKQIAKLVHPKSKILDIGCGNGEIRNFFDNHSYFGVDGKKEFIDSLIKNKIKAEVVDFNKESIPFHKERFDYVLLLDILEHVADPESLLSQAKTRLKEKGKIIITLPNDYHLLNKIRFLFNKHLTEDPFAPYGHLHYFPIRTGEVFLRKNGLRIVNRIIIPPIKPAFVTKIIKKFLAVNFPQPFARDILYSCEKVF